MTLPIIRVFVSSTFDDFWVEREAFKAIVYPMLEDLCSERNMEFRAVDLRWGISAEECSRQEVIDICIRELRRCQRLSPRPNFVVLLGDRFGWQPALPRIAETDYTVLLSNVPEPADRDFLARCYPADLGDDNAVPPCRQLLVPADVHNGEQRLRALLRQFHKPGDANLLEREWFNLSATGLEVLAGAFDDSLSDDVRRNVCFFERSIGSMPATPAARTYRDIASDGPDDASCSLLQSLKSRLRKVVDPAHYFAYEEHWIGTEPADAGISSADINARAATAVGGALLHIFGQRRYAAYKAAWEREIGGVRDLLAGLNPEITHCQIRLLCDRALLSLGKLVVQRIAEIDKVPPWNRDQQAQRGFEARMADGFFGMDATRRALVGYLGDASTRPLLLSGERGSGKTSLLAKVVRDTAASGVRTAVRYIGATTRSSDAKGLLYGLLQALGHVLPAGDTYNPTYLRLKFREALENEPAIIGIDGLEQLPARDVRQLLASLPLDLPPGSKLSLTCSGARAEEVLDANFSIAWQPVQTTSIEFASAAPLLEWCLAHATPLARSLQPAQKETVLQAFVASGAHPLYLRLAAHLAAGWGAHEAARSLPTTLAALVAAYLKSLDKHGSALVQAALSLLAVSRSGLAEQEILALLSDDAVVMAECAQRYPKEAARITRLPDMLWARLYADLEPYLLEASSGDVLVMRLAHVQFSDAILAQSRKDGTLQSRRMQVAGHFGGLQIENQANVAEEPGPDLGDRYVVSSRRVLYELPFQLIEAGELSEAADFLSRPGVIIRMADPHRIRTDIGYETSSLRDDLSRYWAMLRKGGHDPYARLETALQSIGDPIARGVLDMTVRQVLGELRISTATNIA
jgi:hypothetical protein